MSILGNRVLRVEDPKLLTAGGTYVDDVELPGAVELCYVRSPHAHAGVVSIDTEAARRAPGVLDVLTAADLALAPIVQHLPGIPAEMARPFLAGDRVRFVGEAVAVVLAETRAEAADGAALVEVEYDPLPAVVALEHAASGETLLFPAAGSNVAARIAPAPAPSSAPGAAAPGAEGSIFDDCEVVVSERFVNQRLAPCPLEVRAAAAVLGEDGRLTHWSTSQTPFAVRQALAGALGVEEGKIRVIAPDVGGGFGAKNGDYPDELLVGVLAHRLGRPVRWCETRSESMLALGHGRAQQQTITLGGSRDGRLRAYRLEVVQDCGAYPLLASFLPHLTRAMASGTYDIERVEFESVSLVTTTAPVVAYRGAGRPEAAAAIERAVDRFAAEIGMDPAELRRRNLVGPQRFPFENPTGTVYDCGDYAAALERLLEASDYDSIRAEQAARRSCGETVELGIGLAVYVEITGAADLGGEWSAVEMLPDGTAVVRTGTSAHGQGHATAWSMLVSDALGIPIDAVRFVQSDTDLVARGVGTFGSRSLQTGGVAARQAAERVVELARELAGELLEADPADLVVDPGGGGIGVVGTPTARRSWAELAAAAAERGTPLRAEVDFTPPGGTFPFGAHLAVVEVDTETGGVRLVRLVAVDDAGRILNPLLADGQVHGGLAQGVAQALLEEFVYDAEGNPLTTTLADYLFVTAAELPSFESLRMETPTPRNPLGAKGIGESGTIGSTVAVQNAVVDALAGRGVRHLDMPLSPERVWQSLAATG